MVRPDVARFLDRLLVQTYDDFIEILYQDLDRAIAKLEEDPLIREDDGEDRLTAEILSMLSQHYETASHDEKIGGHADMVVKHPKGFMWIGEAKIHKDYAYLEQGFKQLTTRYLPGTPGADQGALVIYIRVADSASVMKQWQARLASLGLDGFGCRRCAVREDLAFYSQHKHDRTGRIATVRSMAVVLYCNPQDKKVHARDIQSEAGRAVQSVARKAKTRRPRIT